MVSAENKAIHAENKALRAENKRFREMMTRAIVIIENCNVESGVCCCGDGMKNHPNPMSCGHYPVDHGGYYSGMFIKAAKSLLSSFEPPLYMMADETDEELYGQFIGSIKMSEVPDA